MGKSRVQFMNELRQRFIHAPLSRIPATLAAGRGKSVRAAQIYPPTAVGCDLLRDAIGKSAGWGAVIQSAFKARTVRAYAVRGGAVVRLQSDAAPFFWYVRC